MAMRELNNNKSGENLNPKLVTQENIVKRENVLYRNKSSENYAHGENQNNTKDIAYLISSAKNITGMASLPIYPVVKTTMYGNCKPNRRYLKMAKKKGYCYVKLLIAATMRNSLIDIDRTVKLLGPYPKARLLAAMLLANTDKDFYVPMVTKVSSDMMHVEDIGVQLLSELIQEIMLSGFDVKIGADLATPQECDDDNVAVEVQANRIPKQQAIGQMESSACIKLLCMSQADGRTFTKGAASKAVSDMIRSGDKCMIEALTNTYGPKDTRDRKLEFTVRESLTMIEKNQLMEQFRSVNFTFVDTLQGNGHGIAAVARRIIKLWILEKTKVNDRKDMITLIDMGADWFAHAKAGRTNVHCCSPIIDIRDSSRELMRLKDCQKSITGGGNREIFNAYHNAEPYKKLNVRCKKKTQFCDVKAQYAICHHAVYDMKMVDILTAMDGHDINILYVTMHYTADVFYRKTGVLNNVNGHFTIDGEYGQEDATITFGFSNDSSECYVHDFMTYMKLLTMSVAVTPNGYAVHIQRAYLTADTMLITLIRVKDIKPDETTLRTRHNFWMTPMTGDGQSTDLVVIRSFEWVQAFLTDDPSICLKPIVMVAERQFYEMALNLALRNNDANFNIANLINQLQSVNYRLTINGTDIRSKEKMTPLDLINLAVAVYIMAFRAKYSAGMVIKCMTEYEKAKRAHGNLFLTFLVSSFEICIETITQENVITKWMRKIIENAKTKKYAGLAAKKEFFQVVEEYTTIMSISQIVEFYAKFDPVVDKLSASNPYITELSLSVKEDQLVKNAIIRQLTPVDVQKPSLDENIETHSLGSSKRARNKAREDVVKLLTNNGKKSLNPLHYETVREAKKGNCTGLVLQDVPADGTCMYVSILKAFNINLTVQQFRTLMKIIMPTETCLQAAEVSLECHDSWCQEQILIDVARKLNTSVCVHLDDGYIHTSFGHIDGKHKLHFKFSGSERLGHTQPYSPFLIEDNTMPLITKVAQDYREMHSFADYKYAELPKSQLLRSRAAYKLIDVLRDAEVEISKEMTVLDLGAAPGAMTLVMRKLAKTVTSVSLPVKDGGLKYWPDVTGIYSSVESYRSDELFDVVLSDTHGGEPDYNLVEQVMESVLFHVKESGVAIVKIPLNGYITKTVEEYCKNFSSVQFIRSRNTRPYSTEAYLVCKGARQPVNYNHVNNYDTIISSITADYPRVLLTEAEKKSYLAEYEKYIGMKAIVGGGTLNKRVDGIHYGGIFVSKVIECDTVPLLESIEMMEIEDDDMDEVIWQYDSPSIAPTVRPNQPVILENTDGTATTCNPLENIALVEIVRKTHNVTTLASQGNVVNQIVDGEEQEFNADGEDISLIDGARVSETKAYGMSFGKKLVLWCKDKYYTFDLPRKTEKLRTSMYETLMTKSVAVPKMAAECLVALSAPVITVRNNDLEKYVKLGYTLLCKPREGKALIFDGKFLNGPRSVKPLLAGMNKFMSLESGLMEAISKRDEVLVALLNPGEHKLSYKGSECEIRTYGVKTIANVESKAIKRDNFSSVVVDGVDHSGTKVKQRGKFSLLAGTEVKFPGKTDFVFLGRTPVVPLELTEEEKKKTFPVSKCERQEVPDISSVKNKDSERDPESDSGVSVSSERPAPSAPVDMDMINTVIHKKKKKKSAVNRVLDLFAKKKSYSSMTDLTTSTDTDLSDLIDVGPEKNGISVSSADELLQQTEETHVMECNIIPPPDVFGDVVLEQTMTSEESNTEDTAEAAMDNISICETEPEVVNKRKNDIIIERYDGNGVLIFVDKDNGEAETVSLCDTEDDTGNECKRKDVMAKHEEHIKHDLQTSQGPGDHMELGEYYNKVKSIPFTKQPQLMKGLLTKFFQNKPPCEILNDDRMNIGGYTDNVMTVLLNEVDFSKLRDFSTMDFSPVQRAVVLSPPKDVSLVISFMEYNKTSGACKYTKCVKTLYGRSVNSKATSARMELSPPAVFFSKPNENFTNYDAVLALGDLVDAIDEFGENNNMKFVVAIDCFPDTFSFCDLRHAGSLVNTKLLLVTNEVETCSDLTRITDFNNANLEEHMFPALNDTRMSELLRIKYNSFSPNAPWLNAAIEYLHILKVTDKVHQDFYTKEYKYIEIKGLYTRDIQLHCKSKDLRIFDLTSGAFLWDMSGKYEHCFARDTYMKFPNTEKQRNEMLNAGIKFVICTKRTEIMLNAEIYTAISDYNVAVQPMPKLHFIQGPPGCGKTYEIMKTHALAKDLVLTTTKAGAEDIQNRARKMGCPARLAKLNYRTIASYLINKSYVREGSVEVEMVYDRVFVDEALMSHCGVLPYIAAISKCTAMFMYGDELQIAYIDRDRLFKLRYFKLVSIVRPTEYRTISYRCPRDVTAVLSPLYAPHGMKTVSKIARSVKIIYSAEVPRQKNTLYLTLLQADKDVLVKLGYSNVKTLDEYVQELSDKKEKKSAVHTIHEAQGKTYEHVIIYRSSPKPLAVYHNLGHAIVAISRHTHSLLLVMPVGLQRNNDAVLDLAMKVVEVTESQMEEIVHKPTSYGYTGGDDILALVDVDPVKPRQAVSSAISKQYHHNHMYKQQINLINGIKAGIVNIPARFSKEKDKDYLQVYYDEVLPGMSAVVYDDHLILHTADLDMNISDRFTIDPLRAPVENEKKTQPLTPVLRTSMRHPLRQSQLITLSTLLTRNFNSPDIVNPLLDPEVVSELLLENFMTTFFSEGSESILNEYQEDIIDLNINDVESWVADQQKPVEHLIDSDKPTSMEAFNRFKCIIKRAVKPSMEPSSMQKLLKGQTVSYNDKVVNTTMCTVMRKVMDRLLPLLQRKFLINCRMSPDELTEALNNRYDPAELSLCKALEVDFTKYDKSQLETLIKFEHKLYLKLGLSKDIADIYLESIRNSVITDKAGGIQFEMHWQRRSGHGTTFLGNTVILMAVLAATYDLRECVAGLFAGDDSVLWFNQEHDVEDRCEALADTFNLEAKLLQYEHPYFCSKFILMDAFKFTVVPDLLKLITKLGRRDVLNWQHLEEYRVSCYDNSRPLFDANVHSVLSDAIKERYKTTVDSTKAINIYCTLISSSSLFMSMFYIQKGNKLAHNVPKNFD